MVTGLHLMMKDIYIYNEQHGKKMLVKSMGRVLLFFLVLLGCFVVGEEFV